MLTGLLLTVLVVVLIPLLVGTLYAGSHREKSWGFLWVCGQITIWAGFLIICVPLILLRVEEGVALVMKGLGGLMTLLSAAALIRFSVKKRWKKLGESGVALEERAALPWKALVLLLFLLQAVCMIFLAYEEGDDAFYVAVSAISASSDAMYQSLPYTGYPTVLDARHGLAPFPIWISVLSRWTQIPVAILAHVVLPIFLLGMAYSIYLELSRLLFGGDEKKRITFLLLIEVLILFGGQSLYTAENFLLVRTAQGKAVLAAIVIPFLLVQCFSVTKKLGAKQRMMVGDWILIILAQIAGCLCSTQGAVLVCLFTVVVGCCQAVCYRKWKVLLPVALGCVLPAGMVLLYLIVQ